MAGHKPFVNFSPTMITTNALIDLPVRKPSLSNWARFKRGLLNVLEKTACCGSDFDELEFYRTDRHVRQCVKLEMLRHPGYNDRDTCVAGAIQTVFNETGYDLSDMGSIRRANEGVTRTADEWERYFLNYTAVKVEDRAKIVPKFAAACALHIRTKLGALANNEANVLLVQRKYLEICRKHGVRDVDTVSHQAIVLNAVFTESVLDEIATSRRRLPGWMKWLEDVPATTSVPAMIC